MAARLLRSTGPSTGAARDISISTNLEAGSYRLAFGCDLKSFNNNLLVNHC
ncbi:hypothetical protein GGR40_003815 [Novosphingobium gossypii]